MKRKRPIFVILRLIPMVLMMAVIFFFSAMPGDESGNTSRFFINSFSKLVENVSHFTISAQTLAILNLVIRKAAHFTEYFIFALTVMYAGYYSWVKKKFPVIIPGLIVVAYAALDELHQRFVPGRLGTWKDVVIDCAGAFLAILIYAVTVKKHENESKAERQSRKAAKHLKKKAKKSNKKENLLL